MESVIKQAIELRKASKFQESRSLLTPLFSDETTLQKHICILLGHTTMKAKSKRLLSTILRLLRGYLL